MIDKRGLIEMHPFIIYSQLMSDRAQVLQRDGAATRPLKRAEPDPAHDVVIRWATHEDGPALAALAALDAAQLPLGPALVAEVEGSPLAVLPLDGGRSFGDPFRQTGELVALLELRARQIRREESDGRGGRGRLGWLAPAALRRLV